MNPETVPEMVWFLMAQKARLVEAAMRSYQEPETKQKLQASAAGAGNNPYAQAAARGYLSITHSHELHTKTLYRELMVYFRDSIYKVWARDYQLLDYLPNADYNQLDWADKCTDMQGMRYKHYPEATGLKGKPYVQYDLNRDDTEPPEVLHRRTRLGEEYADLFSAVSRIQFFAYQNGGLSLFNVMQRMNQQAIKRMAPFPVVIWKVFADKSLRFNAESCVIYLSAALEAKPVQQYIKNYLWPAIANDVDPKYAPIGLFRVADKPLWGIQIPTKEKWDQVFDPSIMLQDSAAYLVTHIMTLSFMRALSDTFEENEENKLIARAKRENREIVEALYRV